MHPSPPLSRIATAMAGRPVAVLCSDTGQDEGTSDALRTVRLDFAECRALLHRRWRGPDDIDAAEASAVLAHEVGHIRLGGCELAAETYAMGHWRSIFRRIVGRAPDSIDAGYVQAVHRDLPAAYREPCR